MELSEKIQKLRKERGITQEQFAEQLFVSRTAVSKWETGRGTPNMESLQMIAKYFEITLDELLCAEEIITIAKKENKENINRMFFVVDGIFNMSAILCIMLPLYKIELSDSFHSVPLYQFTGWLAAVFWIFPIVMAVCGVIQIFVYKSEHQQIKRVINMIGLIVNTCAVLVLILSGQPYPAVLFFMLLFIKGTLLLLDKK